MLQPSYTKQFERDVKRIKKRGKDTDKLKAVMGDLIGEKSLATKHRDHALLGTYKGRRECHIEPDWLLIYKLEPSRIIFERTGTHTDLFD